jgi:Mn-dependent DtxR family transcriptional regulator
MEALLQLVQQAPKLTAQELAACMGVTHPMVLHHLAENGYVSKLKMWLPHALTENDRDRRRGCCYSLLSRFAKVAFFDRLITADEK